MFGGLYIKISQELILYNQSEVPVHVDIDERLRGERKKYGDVEGDEAVMHELNVK